MENFNNFDSNIKFYKELFELNDQEKEIMKNLSEKIINLRQMREQEDLSNPLIQESIFKSAVFCIQANKRVFSRFTKEEHERNTDNYAYKTKSDIQKNFKNFDRLDTILRYIKEFLNLLSNNDEEMSKYTKLPLEILGSISFAKNLKRKLDEIHNYFFDLTELSFLFKKLIWAVFICLVRKDELKTTTFYQIKLLVTVCEDIFMRIPNIFYPTRFGNEMKNIKSKRNIIKNHFKNYSSEDNSEIIEEIHNLYSKINIFTKEITLEGEDLSSKAKIENIISELYDYYSKNILIKLNFDSRTLFLHNQIEKNSPKRKKIIISKNLDNNDNYIQKSLITCNRELFKEEKEAQKSRKLNLNSESCPLNYNNINLANEKEATLMMTTYTRVWNLQAWAKGVLKNYGEINKYIINLQEAHKPKYLNENEYKKFIPIDNYSKTYMNELNKLLDKYRVNSNFEIDLMQAYIYFLFLIIKNDTNIFSENFSSLLLYNDDFIKAVIALSFELVLTIYDISEIELNVIYEQLNLDVYDFWKVILPSNSNLYHIELQKHLEEIDYQLSTFLLWRNPSEKFKNELKDFLMNDNLVKDENEKQNIYKMIRHESTQQSAFLCHNKKDFEVKFINDNFKKNSTNKLIFKDCYEYVENYNKLIGVGVLIQRLIYYCTSLSKFIFDNFSKENIESKIYSPKPIIIKEHIKKETEFVIKNILTNYEHISILWGLHIDQFILSSIILILDKYDLFCFPIESNINTNNEIFKDKINENILYNSYNKSKLSIKENSEVSHIFYHVKISNQKFISIFEFYNEIFKKRFMKYYKNINNIQIKPKIDYFDVQKDLKDLLKLSNNAEDENEFDYLEKPTKRLKVNENKYILLSDGEAINGNSKVINNVGNTPLLFNYNFNNNKKEDISFNSKNNSNDISETISLLKKLNLKKNNKLYFNPFNEEKYSAYRNDNLKLIYNNIIKSELPPNEGNRKTNKDKINKLKELIKSKNH